MNQVIKKTKSTDLNVRQIPGSEVHFFFLCSLARFIWVCMKYIHMSYWPSVKSGWLDIDRVLFLHLKTQKKNEANIQPPRLNRLGQERLQSLDLVNKGLTILKKYFALIKTKNDLFILRAEKESHRVCDTINPRGPFDFFFVLTASAASSDFVANTVQ